MRMLAETRHALFFNRTLFAIVLLAGLYFPSSYNEGWSATLTRLSFIVSMIFLIWLALRTGVSKQICLWISSAIVIWLCFCTFLSLFSSLHEITLSPLTLFPPIAFLFSIKVIDFRAENLTRILAMISMANVCMAIAMLTSEPFQGFMASYYNNFSSDLIMDMVGAKKPVLTFATHSLAGAFVYVFFWLNFRTYQKTGKRLHLLLAVLHVAMCIAIMSITSLALSLAAIVELTCNFKWLAAISAASAYFLIPLSMKDTIGDALSAAVWHRESGGYFIRYFDAHGSLANAFAYIHNHPLLPMGLMYSHDLFDEGAQTDSGPVSYFLRGSIVLVLLMYGGFFLFLRRNLLNKWDCYRLFLVVCLTELGAVVLVYPRSFLLIPAFIIYLNSVPVASSAQVKSLQPIATPVNSWI
jgi:hypothetical protein